MIKLFCLALSAVLLSMAGTAQTSSSYEGNVRYESAAKTGTVTVLSSGFDKKRTESAREAAVAAFYALLFRGIPGSQYDLPMVPNENERKNDPFITSLLNGGYNSFVLKLEFVNEEKKTRRTDGVKGKMANYRISINCDALRRALEQNYVIRKFGI